MRNDLAQPCREYDRGWWDHDATETDQTMAAALCHTCPIIGACADLADQLGDQAAGTYAGRFLPWVDGPDETAEWAAVLTPKPADAGTIDVEQLTLWEVQ